VRLRGLRIEAVPIRGAVNPHIGFSQTYAQMDALIEAGATIWELHDWFTGKFPPFFLVFIQGWQKYHHLIRLHAESAANEAARKKGKKGHT